MKRLTISMSDELFSKLDSIENKSLFIRKLIERELDTLDSIQDIGSNIPRERDIATLRGNIDELFTRLSGIESQLATITMQESTGSAAIPIRSVTDDHEHPALMGMEEPLPPGPDTSGREHVHPDVPDSGTVGHHPENLTEEFCITDVPEDADPYMIQDNPPHEPGPQAQAQPFIGETPATQGIAPPVEKPYVPGIEEINTELETSLAPEPQTTTQEQDEQSPVVPEPAPLYDTLKKQSIHMPELEPQALPEQSEGFAMPNLKPQVMNGKEQPIVIPEFGTVSEIPQQTDLPVPAGEPQVESQQANTWTMPDFGEQTTTEQQRAELVPRTDGGPDPGDAQSEWVIPELRKPAETEEPGFTMPELKPPAENRQEQAWTIPEVEPAAASGQDQEWVLPELKPPAGAAVESTITIPESGQETQFSIPEFEPPAENAGEEQQFRIPDMKPPAEEQQESTWVMPELKPTSKTPESIKAPVPGQAPPFQSTESEPFVMPEFNDQEKAEQATPFMSGNEMHHGNSDPGFTLPDLKAPEANEEAGTYGLPDLQPATAPPFGTDQQGTQPGEKEPLFKLHSIPSSQQEGQPPFVTPAFPDMPQENVPLPPFNSQELQMSPPAQRSPERVAGETAAAQPAGSGNLKRDKLGSNILMYMPHGAKVKRDIIKSLISKQFSESEIDARIAELVSEGTLKLAAEEGTHYLIRP